MRKILLIKTGRSETFSEDLSTIPSLGDVLRTTVLLHRLSEGAESKITWITSKAALPLLRKNPMIHELLDEESIHPQNLETSGRYDVVVNLEKDPRWQAWMLQCRSDIKYGFSPDHRATSSLAKNSAWQDGLFQLIDQEWRGEDYVYGGPEPVSERFDLGLNWVVGEKWPQKAWDKNHWQTLFDRLSSRYSISWQRGFDSLDDYSRWISSCRTVITSDTLGLHLALALRKKVIALFGPTASQRVPLYGRGMALTPRQGNVVDHISVDQICAALTELD